MSLDQLPNIGKQLASELNLAGIHSDSLLKEMGTETVLVKLATVAPGSMCINKVYAIEGAIQGIRWHHLDANRKAQLKDFFHTLVLD